MASVSKTSDLHWLSLKRYLKEERNAEAVSASLFVDTRLGLIKGILREKPELVASEQGGELESPLQGCKTKIRLFSI